MTATRGLAIPLCDLQAQFRPLQTQLTEAVNRVLASGQVINGPDVTALEEEVARYCGVGYAIGCSSGSDALLLALAALEIGPGDEVIVPPFTFFATASAVSRLGARPVFADIDADTCNLDPLQVENKITPRTRAIIPVHLFGQCAEMNLLWRIAERHNLTLVEDAAQAFGAEYQGKKSGSLGSLACLSFYPSKNLGGYGDAGMVLTSDPEWADRLACLRVHGMKPKYYHHHLGWNSRLDTLHAALLRVKLPHVDAWIDARQAVARRYDQLVEEYHLNLFLTRPVVRPRQKHAFNQYVVRVARGQRDALVHHLKSENIGCEIYYPVPLHLQKCFAGLSHRPGDFPISEAACEEVLALPMYPELTEVMQRRVIESCATFARQRARRAA
jgi:dTDP-4-amino-4,6-dideoxygalactose transaminase